MIRNANNNEFIIRPRVTAILTQAVKKPLTIICAGMGCGKTRAVYDFTQECGIAVMWIQFTPMDNAGIRLWDKFVSAIAPINKPFALELQKLGYPDTEDKLNIYFDIQDRKHKGIPCIFVVDDFHHAKDPGVLKVMERIINNTQKNRSIILISRELPQINISSLMARDNIYIINEAELNFTENEISQYLIDHGLGTEIHNLETIYSDTNGWAFLMNFIMRMLKKSPGYMGYVNDAVKREVLQLIEMEVWNIISERLRQFLLRLSLITHYSGELVNILAGNDEGLLSELRRQNAFIRFNEHMSSWHIYPYLLDFLSSKQSLLSDHEKRETYQITADWCLRNNFIIDALLYYEKTGDYETIIRVLFSRQPQFISDNAPQLAGIFSRAPEDIYDRVTFAAVLRMQIAYYLYGLKKASELADYYEAKYLSLPEDGVFKNKNLGSVYYFQGFLRLVESTFNDRYDFDKYFAKQYDCLKDDPIDAKCWYQHPTGLWTNIAGASRKGAPQEFAEAMTRSSEYLQKSVNGMTAGFDDLCRGELLFYQGDINQSKILVGEALKKAQKYNQLTIIHRAMFYIIRIAVFQGDYATTESMIKEMEKRLVHNEYFSCIINCEISIAWFYCMLRRPETIPNWLKEKFASYIHASTPENFGNQIKARYYYLINNYIPLLAYMEDKKRRESILFERIEMLAMEACVRYKMNDKAAALKILLEAYKNAAPNGIVMPFIELGKDMRTLISFAESCPGCDIPKDWLKNIKYKASAYARNQLLIMSDYAKRNELGGSIALSLRENEILQKMYEGFPNAEIAARLNLSINTVKMHISSIYNKLGARNKADVFRIAAERNLL